MDHYDETCLVQGRLCKLTPVRVTGNETVEKLITIRNPPTSSPGKYRQLKKPSWARTMNIDIVKCTGFRR